MDDLNNKPLLDYNNSKEKNEFSRNKINLTKEIKINKKFKTNFKKSIIKRNNIHNSFGHQLTYNKKLSCELDSLPTAINQFFRKSLDKYKFQMEVYVPHSMRISKKEYYNKNYMLNNLVKTNYKIEGEKNKILNITKETKKFSTQYKLVKSESQNRQKEYLSKLENEYKNKISKDIEYGKEENIFTPSCLLDINYGNNLDLDVYKYGQNNEENIKDKYLLQKFYDVANKNIKNEEKEEKIEYTLNEKEEKIEKLKNELIEETKIKNMSKKEYLDYSENLKKEINKLKNMLNDNKFSYFFINNRNKSNINKKNNEINKKKENIFSYNYKSTEKYREGIRLKDLKKVKNNKLLLDLNSSQESFGKEGKIKTKEYLLDRNKIKRDRKYFNLINRIPKLTLNKIKKISAKKGKIKETKELKLNQLYNTLSTRTNSKNSDILNKQLNQYITKYNQKKLPVVNIEKGSNIHNLAESAQNIINDNNIVNISKLNENLKKDFYNDFRNINKNIETENIINIDNKILGLHYEFADSLLSNKRDKFMKYYKK